MYNNTIQDNAINSLESKITEIANVSVLLASQGYFSNKKQTIKHKWSSILIDAFENINVLNKEQQDKIEILFNEIFSM